MQFRRCLFVAAVSLPMLSAPAFADIVVKFGHSGPLTGPAGHLGKENENAVRLALEEANAKGMVIGGQKVSFELDSEDDAGDPRTGTLVAQKLADAKVSAIIGHMNSGVTIPASKIYAAAGIPHITPSSTNPKLTEQGYATTFRLVGRDDQQGPALAIFGVQKLKGKTFAVIDDRTAYGQGLADEFEKKVKALGGKVVSREFTSDKATDFMSILTSIKGRSPDVVMYGGMDATAGPLLVQMRRLGVKSKVLLGDGASTGDMVRLGGEAMDSTVYSSQAAMDIAKMPGAKELQAKYQKRFGVPLQGYGYQAYDATNFFLAAMVKAKSTDPKVFVPAMHEVKVKGVIGPISFDAKGDMKSPAITIYGYDKNFKENAGWKAADMITMK
ncbi:branched-chain amino acid ABC transporter substrate-binding protein [Leeia oryzae]|uniref:branched-chain amino acid ABC transporter substrate-binding protein n=1 Tax=Leeia oryzae TaxID=356662 RepID=UPI00037EF37E|nr:ABC transporter substrate-binding protein [Leeia oryzae]